MDTSIIGIGIALFLPFSILYTRKEKWQNPKIIWIICGVLLFIGVLGIINTNSQFKSDRMTYFGLCLPIVYWIFDRIFKRISERIHQRDFILYLRNSGEINDSLGAKNPHVKASDKLFSIALLIIIMGSLVITMTQII
ncbi:hypothetical protein [Dokdonia sp.]|uniref:hypothetical protein n=1 Tax=Dokdonia sp. TaxID=2024995 RepID=UPI00326444F2